MSKLPAKALLLLLRVYALLISPYMPGQCRYTPTCSSYAAHAISRHGAVKGTGLTVRRLARCTSWRGAGPDPVPEKLV